MDQFIDQLKVTCEDESDNFGNFDLHDENNLMNLKFRREHGCGNTFTHDDVRSNDEKSFFFKP